LQLVPQPPGQFSEPFYLHLSFNCF
jgi:hypothetical protein